MEARQSLDYFKGLNCAVTVCDTRGVVLYMNNKAVKTFGRDLTGQDMLSCHNERSRHKIEELITQGATNSYTIEKRGVRKLIYQTPWYEQDDVTVGGLVELSMEIPQNMPHHVRE